MFLTYHLRNFYVDIYFPHFLYVRHLSETSDHLQGLGQLYTGNFPWYLAVDIAL